MAEYKRGRIWWVSYQAPDGKIRQESTGQTDRRIAQRYYRDRKREVALGTWRDPKERIRAASLANFAEGWFVRQHERGLRTASDIEQRGRAYVLPALGEMRLDEIRPRHVIEFVESLKKRMRGGEIAPRTVHHIYDVLKWMCRDAQIEELIIASPCVLPPGTLPPKRDKETQWRSQALFTREEAELLFSDEQIPMDRRTFYALELLTGCRFGEAAGRRWRDYDPQTKPLGRLVVDSQYEGRDLKSPRGDAPPRAVPVHPTLAAILAEWRLSGFPMFFGRAAEPDDFIVPREDGKGCRSRSAMYKRLQKDCAALGIRGRRQHDTRRTFITLARADGADREVLRAITHGAKGDVFDLYTSWPWETLCRAIHQIRLRRLGLGGISEIPSAERVS